MTDKELLILGFQRRGIIDSEGVWVDEEQRRIYGGTETQASIQILDFSSRDG